MLEIKYHKLVVCPPLGKEKRYGNLTLTVIHATECGTPKDRDPIEWKLVTDLPVNPQGRRDPNAGVVRDALEDRDFSQGAQIRLPGRGLQRAHRRATGEPDRDDVHHSGMALVLWLTMVNRVSPDLPASLVFTETEIKLLEHLVPAKEGSRKRTVGQFLIRLARLGGYLNRTRDAPPGNMVLWRGMARLTDIHLGYCLAKDAGN